MIFNKIKTELCLNKKNNQGRFTSLKNLVRGVAHVWLFKN